MAVLTLAPAGPELLCSVCAGRREVLLSSLTGRSRARVWVPTPFEGWITVTYNAVLADRVRSALSDRDHVREFSMFGGLALMVDERRVVCVSGGGSDLLVRVAPERDAELMTRPGAQRARMGKDRSMGEGWITVDEQALESDEDLQYWMDVSLDFNAQGSRRKVKHSVKEK